MKTLVSSLCLLLLAVAAHAATNVTVAKPVSLDGFKLIGDLGGDQASFTLSATAHVEDPKGGSLELLSGAVALTEAPAAENGISGAGRIVFPSCSTHAGRFPIALKFDAAVQQTGNRNAVEFRVAPSALQPIVLHGLAADTQFEFAGAARPERIGNDFLSYLPSGGAVKLAWKEARTGGGGQAVLCGGDALADQREPRPHAAGGVAEFQGDAGRT